MPAMRGHVGHLQMPPACLVKKLAPQLDPATIGPPVVPARPQRWRRLNESWTAAVTVLGVGLLIVGELGVAAHRQQRVSATHAQHEIASYRVGDCVSLIASSSGDPGISKSDCGADPSYTVGGLVQADIACVDPNYRRYVWQVDNKTVGALCLAENLIVGHCYQAAPTNRTLQLVDCSAAIGKGYQVAQRLDDVSDVTRCAPNTTAYAYPTPARTYCLTTPQHTSPAS